MIEFLIDIFQRNTLPAARVVTGLARLRSEAPFVGVGMTVAAFSECQPHIPGLIVRAGRVTLLARNLCVKPSQRILGLVVVKLRDILPILEIVALLAVLSQPAVVLVFVARSASLRQAEEGPAPVPHLDRHALQGRDAVGRVASVALQGGVFSLQLVTGLAVIESGGRGCPLDEREVFTIVLGMALGAALAGTGREIVGGVKSAVVVQARGDLCVALQALQGGLSAELVA